MGGQRIRRTARTVLSTTAASAIMPVHPRAKVSIINPWIPFALTLLSMHAIAAVAGLAVRPKRRCAHAVLWLGVTAILICPVVFPCGPPLLRFLASVTAVVVACKLYDYARFRPEPGDAEPNYADFLCLLAPLPAMRVTLATPRRYPRPRLPRTYEPLRVILGLLASYTGLRIAGAAAGTELVRSYFVVDHLVKFAVFAMAVEGSAQFNYGIERLLGGTLPPILNFAILARTPADFWRRYNLRFGAWLHRHVYVPAGGGTKGVIWTFVASAAVHEYVFDVATRQVHGYQTIFFLLHGIGVALSPYLNRLTRTYGLPGRILSHAVTLLFLVGTAFFFFASANKILPTFYSATPWLP